jgi:hypothetical protein
VILLINSTTSISQTTKFAPSFEKTDQLMNDGKLQEAYKLMKSYQVSYPNDFMSTWKAAQLAYWTWDIENAKILYRATLKLNETNVLVKDDFAKMLFAVGAYKEASVLLSQLRTINSNSTEIWAYSVKSFYYNNELNKAMDLFQQMPESIKNNPELLALKSEIAIYKALNILLSTSYIDDTQPLQTFTPKIRVSKMHSSYLNWYIEGNFNSFSNDTLSRNSQTLKMGNKFTFNKLELTVDVFTGATILPSIEESAVIGGLFLSKKIAKGVALKAELSRNPYYFSLPSTYNFVLQDNIGITLSISDLSKFSGNIQYQKQLFNDDNTILAASLWFLSPELGTKTINAKIGYAFEGMDSEIDNFASLKSIPQIIEDFGTTTFIDGIYNSYFTPQNQKIHSALLAVQLKLNTKIEINLVGSYGFSAKWDNPYLFLNEDQSSQLFIGKGFSTVTFQPATYKADFKYVINEKINLVLNYNYFRTAFFTANTYMLNLNYKIFSEK